MSTFRILLFLLALLPSSLLAQSANIQILDRSEFDDSEFDATHRESIGDQTPSFAGYFGGIAFNATPTRPVFTAEVGLRYSYFGLGASYINLLDEDYLVGGEPINRAPGIDFYLYIPTNDMPALHINGGAYFTDSTTFGFGVGFMIPINGGHTGTTAGFGYHTLKGIQLNFGRLLEF